MNIFITDSNVVGETEAQIFETIQQGPVDALLMLRNAGINTLNYRFQEFNGVAWANIGLLGSDTNGTLTAGQAKSLKLTSVYPRIRLVGNASGGAVINFTLTRLASRASGGTLPILSL